MDSWATELGFRFPQLRETSEKLLVLQLSERVLDLIRAPLVVRDRLNKLVKPYLICSNADHITVSQIRSCVWKVAERLGPPAPDLGRGKWRRTRMSTVTKRRGSRPSSGRGKTHWFTSWTDSELAPRPVWRSQQGPFSGKGVTLTPDLWNLGPWEPRTLAT